VSKAKLTVRRLGDVCLVQKGKIITEKETTAGQIPVVAGGSKPAYFHNVPNRDPGTITISASGYAGFVSYWSVPIWASDCITVEPLDPKAADSSYLFHTLKYLEPSVLRSLQRGAAQKHVYAKDIQEIEIPIPTIDEQRRIATILDAADALRSKRRQTLEKLDILSQSIFMDMFGDPAANDRLWPERPLRDICERIQIGPFGSLLHQSDYVDGGIPIVNPMHIVDGSIRSRSDQTVPLTKYAELSIYQLRQGDVVMGRRGEMGRCAVVGPAEHGWLCGSGSLFLRPDPQNLTPLFLASTLSSPRGRYRLERLAQGVTMLNLNSDMVESFAIGLPPMDLQVRFDALMTRRSALSATYGQCLSHLDALFASLQHRAFQGEL